MGNPTNCGWVFLVRGDIDLKVRTLFSDQKHGRFYGHHLFQRASDAVYIYEILDKQPSKFLEVNQKACDLLGYTREELLQLSPFDVSLPSTIEHVYDFFIKQNEGTITYEAIHTMKTSEAILVDVSSRVTSSFNRKLVISFVQEHSKKRDDHFISQNIAYYDLLTSLPNRRFIIDRLPLELESARRKNQQLAVILINLDHFKLINNSFSYSIGDSVLEEISIRIVRIIQKKGTVSHIGGDEFMILLPHSDSTTIHHISNDLLLEINRAISIDQFELYLTASIGISIYPDHEQNSSVLKKNANLAMLHAKERGGNQASMYHPRMDEPAYELLILQSDLHKAILHEEFSIYYQPRVDVKTNKMIAAEALIRWKHPQKAMISPSIFIPLAEKSTMIIDIGNWVIRTVCKQIKTWQDQGYPPIRISVNLSIRQLDDPSFIQFLNEVLSETGIEGDWLELEITESMLVNDRESVIQTLLTIKKLGIKVTIDDFGTGYSSLSYIHNFPIDFLKIDQSFIRDIQLDSRANLVSTIIELGHSLQLQVVAEGVEKEEQLNYLKEKGCDEWQGYLFSPPLPKDQFEELFNSFEVFKKTKKY